MCERRRENIRAPAAGGGKKACAACAAGCERIVRAGAHLLVIVVVRVVADDDEGRVNEAKGDEDVRDLLPLVGLGCERRGQVTDE